MLNNVSIKMLNNVSILMDSFTTPHALDITVIKSSTKSDIVTIYN